jgi:hypothetical protein
LLRSWLISSCPEKLLLRKAASKISCLFGSPLFEWADELINFVGSDKFLKRPLDNRYIKYGYTSQNNYHNLQNEAPPRHHHYHYLHHSIIFHLHTTVIYVGPFIELANKVGINFVVQATLWSIICKDLSTHISLKILLAFASHDALAFLLFDAFVIYEHKNR